MSVLRAVWRPAVLVSVSLLLTIGVVEVFLRVTHLQPDFFWQLDSQVGAIHIPGKRGWAVFRGGKQYIEINSFGYRDRERDVQKAPGTFRVAILGDSFIEALQVSQDDTLAAILERRLNSTCAAPDRRFEVLNFGVSGLGTAEELETLRHRVRTFTPDLVLLGYYTGNDLYDNSPELDVEPNRLHYVLGHDGTLVRQPFAVVDNPLKQWLRAHSYEYLFIRDRAKRIGAVRRALTTAAVVQDHVDPQQEQQARQALAHVQYLRQRPAAVTRAWQLTSALIAAVRAEALKQSAAFGLMVIPNKEEILTRRSQTLGDSAFDYQQSLQAVGKICSDLSLQCLQLADAFAGKPADELYFPLDGHWQPAGHAVAATAALEWSKQSKLVPCATPHPLQPDAVP